MKKYETNYPKFPDRAVSFVRPENRERFKAIYSFASDTFEIMQGNETVQAMEYIEDNLKDRSNGFIEVGSAYGGSFYCWAKVIDGPAISVDLPNTTIANDDDTVARRDKLWNELFPGRPVIVRGRSTDAATIKQVEDALQGRKVDYLFIDAEHSYQGAKGDFEAYARFVRPGGLIGFHDVQYVHKDESGKFFRECAGKKWETTMGTSEGPTPDINAIGMVHVDDGEWHE